MTMIHGIQYAVSGPNHIPDRMKESGLSEPEDAFVRAMVPMETALMEWQEHLVVYAKEAATGKIRVESIRTHQYLRNKLVSTTTDCLNRAGPFLGLRPRFTVFVDSQEQLQIVPKNGAAARMMARYDNLVVQKELGRD